MNGMSTITYYTVIIALSVVGWNLLVADHRLRLRTHMIPASKEDVELSSVHRIIKVCLYIVVGVLTILSFIRSD